FFTDPAAPSLPPLSLHDALPILIFTNTRRVWRTNSRGDYWFFDRASGKLKKLGGDAPEASLMYAKFNPAATQVAYIKNNDIYVRSEEHTSELQSLTNLECRLLLA